TATTGRTSWTTRTAPSLAAPCSALVRRSRRRFWEGDPGALQTLHDTLDVVTRLDRALARLEEWVDDPSEDEAEGEPSRPSLRLVKG
ncbi:MAG TPA: hypothetical protein PK413_19975, partial [Thermoanaerobaculia bacterium]|nr:hypothetical protein [Thermoanaerobaculia bacterium]